jgi:hypothetical protein
VTCKKGLNQHTIHLTQGFLTITKYLIVDAVKILFIIKEAYVKRINLAYFTVLLFINFKRCYSACDHDPVSHRFHIAHYKYPLEKTIEINEM